MFSSPLTQSFSNLGSLDGPLGRALEDALKPGEWSGSATPLILTAAHLKGLNQTQCDQLRDIWTSQFPVVVTSADNEAILALHDIIKEPVPVQAPPAPISQYDFYACARTKRGLRAFCMHPAIGISRSKEFPEDPYTLNRAMSLVEWVRNIYVEAATPNTYRIGKGGDIEVSDSQPQQIYGVIDSWQVKTEWPVTYYWSTCGTDAMSCQNSYQTFVNAWPVYSETNANWNQQNPDSPRPVDYFIMQLSGNFNTTGCAGFYGDRNHQNRIRAYWARTYSMAASAKDTFSFDDLSIFPDYNPQAANPSVTVNTGTSWNLGGTGSVGTDSTSIGFNAGVSFNDSQQTSYDALQTSPDIGSDSNVAKWTYDSWDYVHGMIEPSIHTCGAAGLSTLPSIIYDGTFSPMQTWVWEASESVRDKYNGAALPVNIDMSVLLGWALYSSDPACKPSGPTYYEYDIGASGGSWEAYKACTGDTCGLCFDVSCGWVTLYGTVPLGPNNSASGNEGAPLDMTTWSINIPFASTSADTLASRLDSSHLHRRV